MRCPRCQFENIPGQERCFKCSSILEAQADGLEIHPPRMDPGRRFWRGVGRWGRRMFSRSTGGHEWAQDPSPDENQTFSVLGLALSFFPGLGHAAFGRFREIRLLWLLWLVLFGMGLLLYTMSLGWMLLGLAAACHAYMAVKVDLFEHVQDLGPRLLCLVGLTLFIALVYLFIPAIWGGEVSEVIPRLVIR